MRRLERELVEPAEVDRDRRGAARRRRRPRRRSRADLEPRRPLGRRVNATDNTAAHAHASNVAVAIALLRLGAEPVLQVVCRDKNRLACQADIVGAALHGVENVCCLTGDDVTAGDEPEARRVFDLDGPQLVSVASTLAARAVPVRPSDRARRRSLFIGAVENPGRRRSTTASGARAKKIEAGARFLQLQICYHPDRLEAFMPRSQRDGLPSGVALLPTIFLARGAAQPRVHRRQASPGISVPAETIERVAPRTGPGRGRLRARARAGALRARLPGVRGLHLTDFRRDGSLSRLCTDLGIAPRSERESHAHRSPVSV